MYALTISQTIIPMLIIIAILSSPVIIVTIVKKRNREQREYMLKQNHCSIGCKNCNAQQCPNNPNYISKLK